MRTKKIFRIGIFVIIFICLLNPLSYLILGKRTTGKVVGFHERHTGGRYAGTFTSAVIEFQTDSLKFTFAGEENVNFNYGDTVKVIYYSFAPEKAKIFSILGLFTRSLIELAICLFVWFAFRSSFNTIFDKPIIIKKVNHPDSYNNVHSDLPNSVRYIFIGILLLFMLILIFGVISIISVYFEDSINIQGLLFVIGPLVFLMFFIFKEIKNI
jgi:hypothetical protein